MGDRQGPRLWTNQVQPVLPPGCAAPGFGWRSHRVVQYGQPPPLPSLAESAPPPPASNQQGQRKVKAPRAHVTPLSWVRKLKDAHPSTPKACRGAGPMLPPRNFAQEKNRGGGGQPLERPKSTLMAGSKRRVPSLLPTQQSPPP